MTNKMKHHHREYKKHGNSSSPNIPYENIYGPLLYDMTLQNTIGNQEVQRLLKEGSILAKLFVNQPGDIYEQEADRVAERILNMEDKEDQVKSTATKIQKKENPVRGESVSSQTEIKINSLKGKGSPLEPKVRDYFQPRFGVDLGNIRIHKESNADKLARAIRARAFTLGNDVVFAKGEYKPETHEGKKLVAHELTHVIQQTGNVNRQENTTSETDDFSLPTGGTPVNETGIVFHDTNLHTSCDTNSESIQLLLANTHIQVNSSHQGDWYYVSTKEGKSGFVVAGNIKTNLPEPNATLYQIKPDDTAIGIAEEYFQQHIIPGKDLRFYVNVLVAVNKGDGDTSRGIYTDQADQNWDHAMVKSGYYIWIPSVEYANSLVGQISTGSLLRDINQSIKNFVGSIFQKMKDFKSAIMLAGEYIPEAIARNVTESVQEIIQILINLALFLIASVALLAVTTAIGAGIGALLGGVGAVPGAAIGLKVGLFILHWLGIGLLIAWVLPKLIDIGASFISFLSNVWEADGDQEKIDLAARDFAEWIGKGLAFILQAVILVCVAWGLSRVVKALANSKLGGWFRNTKFGRWLENTLSSKRVASVKRAQEINNEIANLNEQLKNPSQYNTSRNEIMTQIRELETELYLVEKGHTIKHNPNEGVEGSGRQGDRYVDQKLTEFKKITTENPSPNTIKNIVNNSIRNGGQARNIVIDVRGSSITQVDALTGISKSWGISRGNA